MHAYHLWALWAYGTPAAPTVGPVALHWVRVDHDLAYAGQPNAGARDAPPHIARTVIALEDMWQPALGVEMVRTHTVPVSGT